MTVSGERFKSWCGIKRFVAFADKDNFYNGYEYKEGLNYDPLELMDNRCYEMRDDCVVSEFYYDKLGGFYFCDYDWFQKHISRNYKDLFYMWDVTVPNDAKIITGVYTFKCDKFILRNKIQIWNNEKFCIDAAIRRADFFKLATKQTDEMCLKIVKENCMVLEHVKNKTYEICLTAVKNHGWALHFIEDKTPELCMEAVKTCGTILECIENQTEEMCLIAVRQHYMALNFVKEQNFNICLHAVMFDTRSVRFLETKYKIELIGYLSAKLSYMYAENLGSKIWNMFLIQNRYTKVPSKED